MRCCSQRASEAIRVESAGGPKTEIVRQLEASRQVMRRLRHRIACLWVALALGGNAVGMFCLSWNLSTWWIFLLKMFCRALCDFRIVTFGLASHANNARFVKLLFLVEVVMLLFTRWTVYVHSHAGWDALETTWRYFQCAVLAICIVAVLLPAPPRQTFKHVARATTLVLLVQVFEGSCWTLAMALYKQHLDMIAFYLVPDTITLLLWVQPRWQGAVWREMRTLLEGPVASQGASCIAGLLGQCSPREVVTDARERFKSVSLEDVGMEVLADCKPNAEYNNLAASCDLGRCDAFLSHSWHDDPQAKWKAMQSWRWTFVAEHKREPVVWFDKCCIDQNRIDVDLRCLPVFLMGCSQLVLFCGPTYLSRLWCILELFTYVHMGGRVEDIELVLVLREGHEEEDMKDIDTLFNNFDASECTCSCPEEKDRLLSIVEAAYEGMEEFNAAISAIAKHVKKRYSSEALV